VVAAREGRLLRPDELVHHVNEDPTDDRPENLEITTRADHARHHTSKLSPDERADVRYLRSAGWNVAAIAGAYGVCHDTVYRVAREAAR
jgi:DNA-directed RNA polymerase specialized sigma24 family protein